MAVSTKGRYALRMMLDLALHDTGEFISLKDISKRQGITVKYLEQIVTGLTKSGMVRSQRGNFGGYRLARKPEEYTCGEILRTMEGSLDPIGCIQDPDGCLLSEACTILPFWKNYAKVINDYVDSVTLADLRDQSLAMTQYNYVI